MNTAQIIHELMLIRRSLEGVDLPTLSRALSMVGKNDFAYTYTIDGFDQSPYLTRTLLPRVAGYRPLLHHIHRADQDPHMHNHPWDVAFFTILRGGYVEERASGPRSYVVGDVNRLSRDDFHRIDRIEPNTWTVGLVGERVQDWGFLVDGELVPHAEYFARKGHAIQKSEGRS